MAADGAAEAKAIQDAYAEQLKALYKVLVSNLIDSSSSTDGEKKSLERFSAGLKVAKRARDLALDTVAAAAPTTEVSSARIAHGVLPATHSG